MADNPHDEKLAQWLKGDLSEEELRALFSAEDMLKYKQILAEVDAWVPSHEDFDFKKGALHEQASAPKTLNWWVPYSVAASLLIGLMAVVWFFLSSDEFRYQNTTSEVQQLLLPDGTSEVKLAPGAGVAWQSDEWDEGLRRISSSGMVLFEVPQKGSFEVKTDQGTVHVLGTVFEVRVFEAGMKVACYEGRVQATSLSGMATVVSAGEEQLFFGGEWEDKEAVEGNEPSWLEGETRFSKAPLSEVTESLEKLYTITVITGTVDLERRFTGSIPNDNLDLALKIVFKPLGISYELKEDKLYLSE